MNTNPEVDRFLEEKNHPLTEEIQRIREIILSVDPKITEAIKWKSPTFIYKGNIASYFMNAKKFVSLMFHKGALIKDEHGLLEGDGKEARVARFMNMEDIEQKKEALMSVISEWVRLKENGN
ncbi:MAG: hypothetical protein Mars2KO_13190 [Maribacter sp.]|uniref:DUF1801 domain-containing protein n=1 Tax=Maribacter sp. 2307UL18-2 TaxID=3386274 RepID=UPI0039BCEACD